MRKNRFDGAAIEIGGIIYTTKYMHKRIASRIKKLAVRGEIDFDKRIIELEAGLTPSEEIAVLIHELCHAVLDTIIPADILDDNVAIEEVVIDPFSRILTGALRSAGLLNE